MIVKSINFRQGEQLHRLHLKAGCSRGGLTTKLHALVDAGGRPIALKLTEGQAHDGRSAADMFETVQAGQVLLADRAYDSDLLRDRLRERGAWGNIRLMPNRKNRPAFSAWLLSISEPGREVLQ